MRSQRTAFRIVLTFLFLILFLLPAADVTDVSTQVALGAVEPKLTVTPAGAPRQPGYYNSSNPYDTGRHGEQNAELNGGRGGKLSGWDYDKGAPSPGTVLGDDGFYVLGGSTTPSIDGEDEAGQVTKFFLEILELIGNFFETLIQGISYVFLLGANALVSAALSFNAQIADDKVARIGYNVVLGVANMIFIVALVIIAFATMLRQEGFAYKKALPRLVIAALLINFGFFIVTNWLIEPVTEVTNAIQQAANFNPARSFFDNFGQQWKLGNYNGGGLGAGAAAIFANVLFVFFLNFLGVIALLAFAAMLFIRYIALVILIILLPLAWAAWIFPNLKIPGGSNPWPMWWENFTRWLLFAPFALFFFWLANQIATNKDILKSATGGIDAGTDGKISQGAGGIGDIAGMIAVVGILLGGLIVSNKMGINGAGYALAVARKSGDWSKQQAQQLGLKYGYKAYRGVAGEKAAKRLQTAGVGKWWSGFAAPVRATGRQATRTTAKAESLRQDALKKKFEGLAPFQIGDMYEGLNDEEKMAAVQHMIDKGYQWELPEQWTKDLARWSRKDKLDRSTFDRRGRKKLELDAFDKGYFADVLAAMEDEKELMAIGDIGAREKAARGKGFKDEDIAKGLDAGALRARTEAAMEKNVKILGHKGIPNIDPRILSGEASAFRDPKSKKITPTGDQYRNLYTDSVMEHMPTAAAALYGRTRGDGAPFMVEKTEEWIKRWDDQYLIPKMSQITAQLSDEEKAGKTPDEIKKLVLAANREKKVEWVNANWDEKTANRAATKLGAYLQTGKRAWFFPTTGGEPPTAPPA